MIISLALLTPPDLAPSMRSTPCAHPISPWNAPFGEQASGSSPESTKSAAGRWRGRERRGGGGLPPPLRGTPRVSGVVRVAVGKKKLPSRRQRVGANHPGAAALLW